MAAPQGDPLWEEKPEVSGHPAGLRVEVRPEEHRRRQDQEHLQRDQPVREPRRQRGLRPPRPAEDVERLWEDEECFWEVEPGDSSGRRGAGVRGP